MLRNKVAFITGAAGCLGSATARKLVKDGFKVLMVDTNTVIGEKIAKDIGPDVIFSSGNIVSETDMTKSFNIAKENFGRVDVIVNCAGTFQSHLLFNQNKQSLVSVEKVFEEIKVNLGGVINVLRLGAKYLSENEPDEDGLRGVIINTSGYAATDGQKGQVILSAVWGGISCMTLPLCRELGSLGIRIMTISPGLFTSGVTEILPHKVVNYLSNVTPSPKRFGQQDEFALLVKTIIDNNFLNGEVVRIDGGLRMSLFN